MKAVLVIYGLAGVVCTLIYLRVAVLRGRAETPLFTPIDSTEPRDLDGHGVKVFGATEAKIVDTLLLYDRLGFFDPQEEKTPPG